MLEYRAMGGLSVVDGGDELSLGGPRQRRLAAVLLIDRNRVVSVDRLGDVVFAGAPTPGAATTLRSYVARLRRVVERPGSESRVVTRPPGYMLEVGDGAFDVARFEGAVAAGRSCLTRGDAAGALQVLGEGLGLWRGVAYAEFADEDWARPEAQRLGELRLVAYELLADAELACGRAAEVVSGLEALAAEHPLREAFQAKLMLALYRSGRQVEALRVYQAHRQVLAGELGLDPPPELAELEGRILLHDEALRELEPGELRLRGYRLGERLGTGRDGTVYTARLPGVDRDIAIRVVPEDLANDPGFVRSFDADARRVAALRHPAVVPLYDWWREPGAAYVVMRRMRGGTLRDRVQVGPVAAREVAALVARVGAALVAAAEAGIAHGRVVAESILFDEGGHAYLADFPLGTGGARVPGEDVRDLAAAVGEALTGQRPIGTAIDGVPPDPADVLTAALSDAEAPPLESFVPAVVTALSGETRRPLHERPNPYKGLQAFDEPDAEDFFGRDGLVDEILARLSGGGPRGRLVLVVGGSGSGKSSLVRAGLLPRVRRGGAAGSAQWFVAAMVPGASPFEELAEALRRVAVIESDGLAQELASSEDAVDRVLRRIVAQGGELLLVVDQLEELFTLAEDGEQRAFLDGVCHALSVVDSRLRVVATLRADFYDRPLRFERFGTAVGEATVPVPAMSAAELEAAIVDPVERTGGRAEPALVAELVGAVLHEPAALPSLQFTLYELAERSPDRDLTLTAYRKLGGLDAAIAARAEVLYGSLDDHARGAVRRMFERLVVVGVEGEPTRRRVLRSELEHAAGPAAGEVRDMVEMWAQARLLTLDRHPESREPTVEVAHEALLREWPRLRGWLGEDREEIVALGHLREAAAGWAGLDRDPGALYRGARLDTALLLADPGARTLPPLEREFLDASRTERDRERQREVDQLHRTARANRRLRAQLVALAIVLVVAVIAGLVAVRQRDRAQESAADADAAAVAADARRVGAQALLADDNDRSLLLAVEGVRLDDSTDTRANLLAALSKNPALVRSARIDDPLVQVDVSPDGEIVATGGPEQGVWFRDADNLDEAGFLGEPSSYLRFSPDGEQVAVALNNYTNEQLIEFDPLPAILVDATTFEREHAQLGDQPGPCSTAGDVHYSADGRFLAVAFDLLGKAGDNRCPRVSQRAAPTSSVVAVWDVTAPEHPIQRIDLPPSPFGTEAYSVALSPDGRLLYVSAVDPPHVTVYQVATGEPLRSAPVFSGQLEISPDGSLLAGPFGNEIVLLDAATLAERRRLRGHTELVLALRFSHDGGLLASASDDRTAIVWDLATGDRREQLRGHAGGVWDLAFSPDDTTLYTASIDRAVLAWDLAGHRHLAPRQAIAEPVVSELPPPLAHSAHGAPTGDAVAYLTIEQAGGGEQTSTVQWLDITSGRAGEVVHTGHRGVSAHAWRPDGRRFATTGEGGVVRVWDWRTEALVAERRVSRGPIVALAYTSDGAGLVVGEQGGSEQGGRVFAVDATTLAPKGRGVRFDDRVVSVAASPDNRTAIALTAAPGFALVDLLDGRVTRDGAFGRAGEPVPQHAEFSPDGQRVAISTGEGVGILDVETGDWVRTPVDGHDGPVPSLAYAPDSTILASGSDDGRVGLWDGRTGALLGTMLPGRPNTPVTVEFRPDGHTLLISSVDGAVYTWDTRPQHWVDHACAVAGRNLAQDEWRDAFGDRPYRRTCPQYPVGK
jgi:WD40 repeat protein/DNA-binding SARP family transcriptional activator